MEGGERGVRRKGCERIIFTTNQNNIDNPTVNNLIQYLRYIKNTFWVHVSLVPMPSPCMRGPGDEARVYVRGVISIAVNHKWQYTDNYPLLQDQKLVAKMLKVSLTCKTHCVLLFMQSHM